MSETYRIKCRDCGNELDIISPATLSCNKCGCGTHIFEQTMKFTCFYKHEQVGKKSAPCMKCINVERTMWRNFAPSKHIGDEANRMPETKTIGSKTVKTKSGIKRRKKKK